MSDCPACMGMEGYGHLSNCLHVDAPDEPSEQAEIDRLNARIKDLEAWIPVSERLPQDGQWVFGMTAKGGVWYEKWDKDEPLGDTRFWCAAPPAIETKTSQKEKI